MIFDAHADILTDMYQEALKGNENSFKARHLSMYQQAGITHSIFVNWTNPSTTNPNEFKDIFFHSLQELRNNQDIFHICTTYEDLEIAVTNNKLGIILGIEGLSQLQDLSELKSYYDQGVRHATLTWNEVNRYGAGLNSETEGLTLLGKDLLAFMENHGMIIDLAHSNQRTFQDIIDHTSKPFIISHGNVKALCPHIRNYTDQQLLQLQERGGVIGICGIRHFISDTPEEQTVQMMAKHIDYAVKLIGIDHVGLGFDVCYYLSDMSIGNKVKGFETIADAKNVLIELSKLGYTQEQIQKIAYGNFARIVKNILK